MGGKATEYLVLKINYIVQTFAEKGMGGISFLNNLPISS